MCKANAQAFTGRGRQRYSETKTVATLRSTASAGGCLSRCDRSASRHPVQPVLDPPVLARALALLGRRHCNYRQITLPVKPAVTLVALRNGWIECLFESKREDDVVTDERGVVALSLIEFINPSHTTLDTSRGWQRKPALAEGHCEKILRVSPLRSSAVKRQLSWGHSAPQGNTFQH